MNNNNVDVLIVGAGPAGLGAANALSESGLNVLCIDSHRGPGTCIRCAEGAGQYFLDLLPFRLPKEVMRWPAKGIRFFYEGYTLQRKGGIWKGCGLDRAAMERFLCERARSGGVEFWFGATLVDLERDLDYQVLNAVIRRNGRTMRIYPKRIIAADGVDSPTAHLMGIPMKKHIWGSIRCYNAKVPNLEYADMEQIYIGDYAPHGYGFIFPTGKQTANIGVGSISSESAWDGFVQHPSVARQLRNMTVLEDRSKRAPFGERLHRWAYGNVLFAGDAANHNYKPFIEGCIPSVLAGLTAGQVIQHKRISDSMYRKAILNALPGLAENAAVRHRMEALFADPDIEEKVLLLLLSAAVAEPDDPIFSGDMKKARHLLKTHFRQVRM